MKTDGHWNPYVAGITLGLVVLASFIVTGRGVGASGAVHRAQATAVHAVNPTWAEEHGAIGRYFADPGQSALNSWIVFLALGTLIGGALGAVSAGRVKLETIHGPHARREDRWILAVLGGTLSGYAAHMARGCTSGQAITGGAQLALGSWVFMFAVFGGAYGLAYLVRKQWI